MLGAELGFAVESDGVRVAMVRFPSGPPAILFASHLEGARPLLVYRVAGFGATLAWLEARGWVRQETFEIPHGPCCTFETPGGHRVGFYELTRPGAAAHFEGRRDF